MKENLKISPPQWAVKFFRWFCNDHLSEGVLGDITELYERRVKSIGRKKANLHFIWNVIQFIQPFALRKKRGSYHINTLAMFSNNLKVAWRSMARQKMYTAIKIGGFALGLATCIVIAIFLRHELSYDKNYVRGENIYRVLNNYKGTDGGKWTSFPAMVASLVKKDYPEVEQSGRLIPYNWFNAGTNLFRREDQAENTYEEKFAYADQSLVQILQIPIVYGNPLHVLDKPNTILISRKKAEKYFPGEDPTGRTVIFNDDKTKPFTIGGVMEDFPQTSHLQFDFLITLTEVEFWQGEQTSWCCWNYNVYVTLRPGTDPAELEKKMLKMRDTYYVKYLTENGDQSVNDVKKNHEFVLQAVSDIHLYSDKVGDAIPHGDIRYVWLFGGIACFILLLACINFINLSTAKSANRAKEVGLRKVVGSLRGYIVRQFLSESLVYSFISFILAVIIVTAALPYFNVAADLSLNIPWGEWWFFPILIVAAIVVGVLAGIYPSFYLSAFKPVDVLKGNVARGAKGSTLRSSMVVFQFTTSIVLIIGTIVIYKQMSFILNKKVGFDKDQVIMLQGTNTLGDQVTVFKEELLNIADVKSATASYYLPVESTKRDQNTFWNEGRTTIDVAVGAQRWNVDEDYLKTLGIKLIDGRNFDRTIKSDSNAIIINQAMAKALNLKKPVGSVLQNWALWHVIGVVEDFNFDNMRDEIRPLCFGLSTGGNIIAIKVSSAEMKNTIEAVSATWKKFMPNQPIRYTFLDESYAMMYKDVQRMGNLFAGFASLAIIVACLGLFALSAFMVEQRSKEISIRLVLGASVNSIFKLLTQNFVTLVVISFVIAVPLAWYMMDLWLQDYKYKIDLTWDIFITAGIMAVVIAVATVSYQSIRAAFANPASTLRSE